MDDHRIARDLVLAHYHAFAESISPDMRVSAPAFELELKIRGPRSYWVTVGRPGRLEEGREGHHAQCAMALDLHPHLEMTGDLSRFMAKWIALERREVAVTRPLASGMPPMWALRMNRVLRRLIEHARNGTIALEPNSSPERGAGGVPVSLVPVRLRSSMRGSYVIQGDRLDAEDEIEFGERRNDRGNIRPEILYRSPARHDTGQKARIILKDARFPETTIQAMVGMDLGEVIGHPAIDGPIGVRVTRAEQTSNGMNPPGQWELRVEFETVEDWLAEPPKGADAAWRGMEMRADWMF